MNRKHLEAALDDVSIAGLTSLSRSLQTILHINFDGTLT